MKSTRRLLSIILCLVMCLSLLPTSAFAAGVLASGKAGNNAEFILYTDGKLVISGTGKVLDLAQWSFHGYGGYSSAEDARKATRTEVKTIVVEEGIKRLGDYCFTEYANLSSVSLPASLTAIGDGVFDDSGLKSIIIPGNVTEIGANAFHDCSRLISVTLSSGLKTIGAGAFENCIRLTSIVIPANVKEIGAYAFGDCGALRTVTFQGNYTDTLIDSSAFVGVNADAYYPVDNNSWNNAAPTPFQDYGGRLTWKPLTTTSESEGWVNKNGTWNSSTNQWDGGDWYYYVGGKMLINSWKAYGQKWFYFGPDGRMVTGRYQIDGDYYYFGKGKDVDGFDLGARVSGWVDKEFYDENGVWQPAYYGVDDTGLDYFTDGWQQIGDKWFYIRNKAKVTGWLWSRDYWYYLDPVTGAMVTGWLTWNGNTYYLRPLDKAKEDGIPDREGAMIAGRSATIGGVVYTFDASGALQGGRIDDNPLGIQTGFRNEGSTAKPDWKFYRSNGTKATGWELIDSNWYYFDNNGKMVTGWQKIGGVWYYLTKWAPDGSGGWKEITDPTSTADKPYFAGRMVTGFNTIPYTREGINAEKTYFFKANGALNGIGWIKVGLKWYYLEADGVVATGWLRDGTKWYYLRDDTNPVGEMVTGVFTVPGTLADGKPNNPSGKQSFTASGEWMDVGENPYHSTAGEWKKIDGNWYYFDADGNKLKGWQWIDNKWYYLDPSTGVMLTGWQDADGDGDPYYLDPSGALLTGWQKIDGVWYYLNPEKDGTLGKVQKGWKFVNDNWYYLDDKTGAVQAGWFEVKTGSTGAAQGFAIGWYYLEKENQSLYGAMQKGGWKQIGDKWYFFHMEHDGAYGRLEQGKWIWYDNNWYYVQASVKPEESWRVSGFYTVGTDLYYFDSNGVWQAYTGWKQIGDKWYFFDSSSIVLKDTWISGTYYLGSDGAMLTGWQHIGSHDYYLDPGDGHKWVNADKDGRHLDNNGWASP